MDAPALALSCEDVLATAAPTDSIPIFIDVEDVHTEAGVRVDFGNVVARTRAEVLTTGLRYLTSVSDQATRPLEHDLVAAGCTRAPAFWLSPSVSGDCVPEVIRRLATRGPITSIDYDGPSTGPQ